jgi:hypothetical protein
MATLTREEILEQARITACLTPGQKVLCRGYGHTLIQGY